MEFKHQSVLLSECMESLNIRPDGIYVDGTLGGGGHSYEICRRLSDKGRLIGIDQDEAAIEAARARLGEFKDKVTIIRSNYCNMKAELTKLHITACLLYTSTRPREIPIRRIISIPMRTRMRMASARSWKNL